MARPASRTVACLALVLPWLLAPAPARAQQIGASFVSACSGNAELPAATGAVIEGTFDVGRGWRLHFGLQRVWSETEKLLQVCRVYGPPVGCAVEATRNEVHLTGFRAGVVRPLLDVGWAELEVGAGLSFNQIGIESSTGLLSGLEGNIFEPGGGQVGALGSVALDVTPVADLGLSLTLELAVHRVNFDACAEGGYDPFCSAATFRELQIGVAYTPVR